MLVALLLSVQAATPVSAEIPDGPTVDDRLAEPIRVLGELPDRDGTAFADVIHDLSVNMIVVAMPPGQLASYDRRVRTISVAERATSEDPSAIAAILVHEVEHVRDKDALVAGAASMDCLEFEVRGFETQSRVWRALKPEQPARTPIERELTSTARIYDQQGAEGLRAAVARVAIYQQQCAIEPPA
jgi:hypothetical protein